jgi:hypothetical protein
MEGGDVSIAARRAAALVTVLLAAGAMGPATPAGAAHTDVRFATFNASLNRSAEGMLVADLSEPVSPPSADPAVQARRQQAANVAEIIQRTRPDVVLINEFDFVEGGLAAELFQQNYLGIGQGGADPIEYPYTFVAPSNTGIPTGLDLDGNGSVGGPGDAQGFGAFPGQFGMAVFSMHPIEYDDVRTFQQFLWQDMPGNLIPPGFYDQAELDVLRLSSKSHWDIPIVVDGRVVHLLASHPTPPVFDGPEDRNGRRNHDEIRLWADYIHPGRRSAYIYDDAGRHGGLPAGARFVIVGDQNADPFDGDSVESAAQLLLDSPFVDSRFAPTSAGAVEAALLQGGANATHRGDPAFDTADFADGAPGNLRADYVLPSKRGVRVAGGAVFWPVLADPLSRLTGVFSPSTFNGFPSSDHRLVYLDLVVV